MGASSRRAAWWVVLLALCRPSARPARRPGHGAAVRPWQRPAFVGAGRQVPAWARSLVHLRPAPGRGPTSLRARGGQEQQRPELLRRFGEPDEEVGVSQEQQLDERRECPECGADMRLVRRTAPGHGQGGYFYSCSRRNDKISPCTATRKPVNRTKARLRSKREVPRIILRDYQRDSMEEIRQAFQDGDDGVVVAMATGSGKTSVANGYIDKYERESLVWWTSPSRELLDQAEMNLRGFSFDRDRRFRFGLLDAMPDIREVPQRISHPGGAMVYATEQAFFYWLKRSQKNKSSPKDPKGIQVRGGIPDLIVIDECHWAGLTKIGLCILKWARYHGCRVLGLTATPLPDSPLPVISSIPLVQLAMAGTLAWPRLWRVERLPGGRLGAKSVFDMRENWKEIPPGLLPADMLLNLTEVVDVYESDAERWKKTLIRVATVKCAEDLVEEFMKRGLRAATVNCRTAPASRGDIIREFSGDVLDILVVIGIGTFGLDVPALRTIFITHGMGSPNAYVQLVGRGSRIFDVDYFNVVEFHPDLSNMRHNLWRAPLTLIHRAERSGAPDRPRGAGGGRRPAAEADARGADPALGDEVPWFARPAEPAASKVLHSCRC